MSNNQDYSEMTRNEVGLYKYNEKYDMLGMAKIAGLVTKADLHKHRMIDDRFETVDQSMVNLKPYHDVRSEEPRWYESILNDVKKHLQCNPHVGDRMPYIVIELWFQDILDRTHPVTFTCQAHVSIITNPHHKPSPRVDGFNTEA